LLPSEAARLLQVRKKFGAAVEATEEHIVRHLHALHYSRVPLHSPTTKGGWTRYLYDITRNRILLLWGNDKDVNRVDMMVIEDEGAKISWQACCPMIETESVDSIFYDQGEIVLVTDFDWDNHSTCFSYDILSQRTKNHKLKSGSFCFIAFATAVLDGKYYIIGGLSMGCGEIEPSNTVYCLPDKVNHGEVGMCSTEKAYLITPRYDAAATAYQGMLWLAGGCDYDNNGLSSIEVFDPLLGSWQAAGYLTKPRKVLDLFVINQELYAAGSKNELWIEKRDRQTGTWELVSELDDDNREDCAVATCGSTIYFFGGENQSITNSWNSFDIHTNTWASQCQDVAMRKLPCPFHYGKALCITPSRITWR
jgi:hypothetical protein